jgi:hypothetical protein
MGTGNEGRDGGRGVHHRGREEREDGPPAAGGQDVRRSGWRNGGRLKGEMPSVPASCRLPASQLPAHTTARCRGHSAPAACPLPTASCELRRRRRGLGVEAASCRFVRKRDEGRGPSACPMVFWQARWHGRSAKLQQARRRNGDGERGTGRGTRCSPQRPRRARRRAACGRRSGCQEVRMAEWREIKGRDAKRSCQLPPASLPAACAHHGKMPWPLCSCRLSTASCELRRRRRGLGVEAASCRFVRKRDGRGTGDGVFTTETYKGAKRRRWELGVGRRMRCRWRPSMAPTERRIFSGGRPTVDRCPKRCGVPSERLPFVRSGYPGLHPGLVCVAPSGREGRRMNPGMRRSFGAGGAKDESWYASPLRGGRGEG